MARIKGAVMTRKRRKKTLKLAKGYFGAKSKRFKMAKQVSMLTSAESRRRETSALCGSPVFRLPAA